MNDFQIRSISSFFGSEHSSGIPLFIEEEGVGAIARDIGGDVYRKPRSRCGGGSVNERTCGWLIVPVQRGFIPAIVGNCVDIDAVAFVFGEEIEFR